MIRVLVADSHPVVREGLSAILRAEPDIAIVGQARNSMEALELVAATNPGVILLGLALTRMDGLVVLRNLAVRSHRAKVLVFTGAEAQDDLVEAMKLGAAGILMKSSAPELIGRSIRKVYEGEIWVDANTTAAVIRQSAAQAEARTPPAGKGPRTQLSQREGEIIALVAEGYKNREIAVKLLITEQTVKNHLRNVFNKLSVSDRMELALYAIHNNLYMKE